MSTAIKKDIRQEISLIWFHLKRKLETLGMSDKDRAKLHEQAHRAPLGLTYHEWRKQKDAKNVSSYDLLTKLSQRELVKRFLQHVERGIDSKIITTCEQVVEQFNQFETTAKTYFNDITKVTKSAVVPATKTPTTFSTPVSGMTTDKLLEAMASYEQAGFAPEVARKLHNHGISAIYAKKFIHAS